MALILGPSDLEVYIREEGIEAELITDVGDTPTVPAAAQALGVLPEQIVKTLLFLVKEGSTRRPILVLGHGAERLEKGPLAAHVGVGKKRLQLASAERVIELLGYPAGGVPPFGHRNVIPALMDGSLERLGGTTTVYAGGGDDRTMLALTVAELIRVVQPELVDLRGLDEQG